MNCQECKYMILEMGRVQLLNRTFGPEFDQHILACQKCSKLLEAYTGDLRLLSSERHSQPQDQLYERVVERMKAQSSPVIPMRIVRYSSAFVGAAAAIILGMFVGNQLISPLKEAALGATANNTTLVTGAADELYQDDASLLALETYLSETEKSAE